MRLERQVSSSRGWLPNCCDKLDCNGRFIVFWRTVALAKKVGNSLLGTNISHEGTVKGTSIGRGKFKTSSLNKSKKRGYKKYRGQG